MRFFEVAVSKVSRLGSILSSPLWYYKSIRVPSMQGWGCTPRQVLRTRIQTASWMGKLREKKGVSASWLRAGPGDENIKQSQIFLLWPPASAAGAKKL
ncbi:hypothetical protein ElyMa_005189500 [Elysia marginata]|uniref:Uncharacterized protein n=1 Tax=Elysia marginata TaxID=1093978 RepID=A0AAV4JW98_9GAST|nr:hypothetical protein ElyMa_005189500 [Elysia marginata]